MVRDRVVGVRRVRFPPEVITLAVRWFLHFGLFSRDLEELLAERAVTVDHVHLVRPTHMLVIT
jgi:transposase-like protein